MKLYMKVLLNIFWMLTSITLAIIGIMVIKPVNNVVGIIMLIAGIISFIAWFTFLLITNPEILEQEKEKEKRKMKLKNQISSSKDEFPYIDGKKDAKLSMEEVTDIEELLEDD